MSAKDLKQPFKYRVKNVGNGPLKLWDVFPIGECSPYIQIDFNEEAIEFNDSTYVRVTIGDYWEPVEIQFDTNCQRTGEVIYVLRPRDSQGPNLWLFPNEKYNRDQVCFRDPERYLQLPIIVQSQQDNPLELNFCSIESGGENTSEDFRRSTRSCRIL